MTVEFNQDYQLHETPDSDPGHSEVVDEQLNEDIEAWLSAENKWRAEEDLRKHMAEVQRDWEHFLRDSGRTSASLLKGVNRVYSTAETGAFFDKSNQWMYWGMRKNVFTYKDGSTIHPERVGGGGRRRFTLPVIREIALSCYRRGNLTEAQLEVVLTRIVMAASGDYTPQVPESKDSAKAAE